MVVSGGCGGDGRWVPCLAERAAAVSNFLPCCPIQAPVLPAFRTADCGHMNEALCMDLS